MIDPLFYSTCVTLQTKYFKSKLQGIPFSKKFQRWTTGTFSLEYTPIFQFLVYHKLYNVYHKSKNVWVCAVNGGGRWVAEHSCEDFIINLYSLNLNGYGFF